MRMTFRAVVAMVLVALLSPATGRAQFDLDGAGSLLDGRGGGLDMELEEGPPTVDLSGLAQSCYLPIAGWTHVQPGNGGEADTATADWRWRRVGGEAVPLSDAPISARIAVPAAGSYRLFLRQRLTPEQASPVVLTLRPEGGEPLLQQDFGSEPLDSSMTGREHEAKRRLIVESEPALLGMLTQPTPVWEYVDVELDAGTYELSLASTSRTPRLTGLLLTQAKAFRPSMDAYADYNSMEKVYLRVRVRDAAGAPSHTVSGDLNYHWRGRVAPGSTLSIWNWELPATQPVKTGEWSAFIDATEALVPGPGPWSSCFLALPGIERGRVDVEVAWRPDPAAVLQRLETATAGGSALLRLPHGLGLGLSGADTPAWGMWRADYHERFVTEDALVARYLAWARDAMAHLELPADHPMPRKIIINTSARTTPAYNDQATDMLAALGLNWIQGATPAKVREHGLHDGIWLAHASDYVGIYAQHRADAEKLMRVKIGDEIHTAQSDDTVNADPMLLDGFHDYLRSQAEASGMSLADFLGVQDVTRLRAASELPPWPGIFERRLYYHSRIYAHLASIPGYKTITDGFHARFPAVEVYNNYSPHPLFLTGATMNEVDWFVLCRNQAQTLAWGEDWAYYNGWDLGTAYQCTSYYAAIVAAAARRHAYPGGFYVGSNCGGSANKIFACAAQGVTRLHLYDWGPIDGWPEGSNSWSENQSEYHSIALATAALGPADTIVADGERGPTRVAILYNRSHEIWQGGLGQMNHDWMWTYIAINGASEPVDVITEDDLMRHIDAYELIVVGGLNLAPAQLTALADWVRRGNTLLLTSGAAMYDTANDPNPATTTLSGVRQFPISITDPDRREVVFSASEVSPAARFAATFPGHLRFAGLELTDATAIASWPDGSPAAALKKQGEGRVITLGFLPGHSFRDNGQSRGPEQPWIRDLLRRTLGEPVAALSIPGAETTAFSHTSGMAILLNVYHPSADRDSVSLSVRPDRPVSSVRSALHGDLAYRQDGDRIVITLPVPAPVDTVIIR